MTDSIHIITFEDGALATSPAAMIPLPVIEAALAPFAVSRRDTDRREIEIEAAFGTNPVRIVIDLADDDPLRASALALWGWSDHPAFAGMIHAALASANAALILGADDRPIVGRQDTILHLPQDLLDTLGAPCLVASAAALMARGDISAPPRNLPEQPHHPDQIAYWRQLQVVGLARAQVHGLITGEVAFMRRVIRQAAREGEAPASIAQLNDYLSLVEAEAAATQGLDAPDWQQRALAARHAVSAFGLVRRLDGGRLVTRFAARLRERRHVAVHVIHWLDTAERDDAKARELASSLIARGFAITPPPPPKDPLPVALDDAALAAACLEQEGAVQRRRRDVWHALKAMTDEFMGASNREFHADAEAVNFHGLLKAARKEAREDGAPDWLGRVRAALDAANACDIVQRRFARHTLTLHDHTLMAIGSEIASGLPEQIDAAAAAETRHAELLAELTRRGLPQPVSKPRKRRRAP